MLAVMMSLPSQARDIRWFCNPVSVNLTSSGRPMDAGFRFELGVFSGGFVPTNANTSQWAANWVAAQRTVYNEANEFFTDEHTVTENSAPFLVGAQAYVWGFGGRSGEEWILFRASAWTWPAADPLNPVGLNWNAASATQVIAGSINASGSPFLMKSTMVSGSVAPSTSWSEWQAEALEGISQNGPADDPDGDGVRNDLEFVFGLLPLSPDAVPSSITSFAEIGNQRFLQIGIPRRADRIAALAVEVSTNLGIWYSGTAFTHEELSSPSLLVVRSLVPVDDAPSRFMRLRISVAP